MPQSERSPTRSAILQLREEQEVVYETYDFLDEKRLLLAAELLRQLTRYESLMQQYEILRQAAEAALVMAVRRHGLHGVQVYPGAYMEGAALQAEKRRYMGVMLYEISLDVAVEAETGTICYPSQEAEYCRDHFARLTQLAAELSALSGNMYRLFHEYNRTERRARALENVIIPENDQILREMTTALEELDQEDVLRVHLQRER